MKIYANRTGWAIGLGLAALAAVLVLLAGCGGSSGEPEAQSAPTSSAPEGAPARAAAPGGEQGEAINSIAGTPERLATAPVAQSREAHAAGVAWTAPAGWVIVPTTPGGMRAAQYTAPAPPGTAFAPAEVVFFYFGPDGQGGDLSSNLARWSEQVVDEAGAPTPPAVAGFQLGDLDVTTALYEGTYLSGMPGGQREPLRGWSLLAAVVEGGPEGTLFIRMTGPTPVVHEQREAFEVMVRTISTLAGEGGEPTK